MAMATTAVEQPQQSLSVLDEACRLLKSRFPALIEVIQPDDVCDDLFAADILSDEMYEFVSNNEKPLKDRKRKLLYTALQKIRGNHDRFEAFLVVLEKLDSETTRKLSAQLRDIIKNNNQRDLIKLQEFKSDVASLHKYILQSDDNIEAKYTVMKECITSFFKSQFEDSVPKQQLSELLHKLCYVEMVIPSKLHHWSSVMLEEITQSQSADASVGTNETVAPLQPDKKSFSEAIVRNCLILTRVVAQEEYKKFLESSGHDFDELSVSRQPRDLELERYAIAKRERDKELYIAFRGEPDFKAWQKTGIISEDISRQTGRLPVRFFVEQIQDGYSVIFTGFEFGGLLALSVYTSVWNQTCLSINNLSQNTMCITFGVPLVPLKAIEETLEYCPQMRENSHIFQLQGDLVSRLLRFDDISSTNGAKDHDKFPGRFGAIIYSQLLKFKEAVEQKKNTEGPLSELKSILSDDHLMKQREVKLFGTYHYVHSQMAELVVSQLASQPTQDLLKIPSPTELDKIPKNSNIIKEHSLLQYFNLLNKSLIKSNGTEKTPAAKILSLLKPDVFSITFCRHGDEIALILHGQSLWFCSKIKVEGKSRSIFIDNLEADATNRSVHFNYTPKDENDLIIERQTTTVNIVLYSHFASAINKRKVPVKSMGEYYISYRQRQLAICTPGEVITLSFLSALLECTSNSRASRRYATVCQFLEEASRIVPIESIFYAIANAPHEVAWKCTEAFMSTDVSLPPSLELAAGLEVAFVRLTVGSDPTFLQNLQRQVLHIVNQMSSTTGMPVPPVVGVNVGVQLNSVVGGGRSFSDVVKGEHTPQMPTQSLDRGTLLAKMNNLREKAAKYCMQTTKTVCMMSGKNVKELFSTVEDRKSCKLLSPIEVLKMGRKKLDDLQTEASENDIFRIVGKSNEEAKRYYNEEMLTIIQNICNDELCICTLLLGGFMEQRIRVPLVDSPLQTAHILQTTEAPPAVGVWALFSLGLLDFEEMCASKKGKAMVIKVEKYIKGIFGKSSQAPNHRPGLYDGKLPDRSGLYEGKLQFLLQCLNETVSCNSNYISYSLEAQLADLCSMRDIKPTTRVTTLVDKWDDYFKKNLLYHILQPFRPLVARWIIWCLNIHHSRKELASHTTVGIVGLSNSGKSCLVRTLFKQKTTVGSTSMQRTTVSFLYNLEGYVDGLNVIDFPGIDDADKGTFFSQLLLRLSQLIVFVLDYKRWETKAAFDWVQFFKDSGVPVLICLTHADKLYSSTCLGEDGTETCSRDNARRLIQQELEKVREKLAPLPNWQMGFYSFCQDKDSSLNSEEGRHTLSDVGILSCNDVGTWLETELRDYLKEGAIAERLKNFMASETTNDSQSCGKDSKSTLDETSASDHHVTESQHDKEKRKKSYTTPLEAPKVIIMLRDAKFGFTNSFHNLLAELSIPTDMKQRLKKEVKSEDYDCEFATEKAIDWWILNEGKSWEQLLDIIRKCEPKTASKIEEKLL